MTKILRKLFKECKKRGNYYSSWHEHKHDTKLWQEIHHEKGRLWVSVSHKQHHKCQNKYLLIESSNIKNKDILHHNQFRLIQEIQCDVSYKQNEGEIWYLNRTKCLIIFKVLSWCKGIDENFSYLSF